MIMEEYAVMLYNKDHDALVSVCSTSDLKQAKDFCLVLSQLVQKNMIVDSTVANREPFNWVEVYDRKNQRTLMVNDKEETLQ